MKKTNWIKETNDAANSMLRHKANEKIIKKIKKIKVEFTVQEYEDILSALSISIDHYERKKSNPNFMKALSKLNSKLWKVKKNENS